MGMGASAEEIVSSHFISRTKACFSFIFPEGIICQTTKKKVVVASLVSRQTEWKKSGCWRFSPPPPLPPFFCYLIQLSPPTISEFFSLSPILGEEGGFIYMASRFRKREKEGRGESKYENV